MNNTVKNFWVVCFIAFLVLFNIPGYSVASNLKPHDVVLAWVVNLAAVFAFVAISSFLKKKSGRIFLVVLFLLAFVPNLIVFTYLCIARIQMSNDMFWVIFASNQSESNEYIHQFISPLIWGGQITYLVVSTFLLYKAIRHYSTAWFFRRGKKTFLTVSLLILVSIISFQYLSKTISLIDFYKSAVRYWTESYQMEKEMQLRKETPFDISCELKSDQNVFIVIIGESLTRHHMQIYGYPRPTTPLLEQLKSELFVYKDVISPNTHTIAVLKSALTFANYEHPEWYLQKPSVVELFNKAGFESFWISTQGIIGKWGCSYGVIAKESDHIFDLSIAQQPDAIVFPCLDEILNESVTGNKIIFIHLMGNHHTYKSRYPSDFNIFNQQEYPVPDRPYLNEKSKTTIDEYDNSVCYSDYVIGSIIDKMKAKTGLSSFVLFFSDHGEEVYDFRDMSGHAITSPSTYQCEIPFILWCSPAYLEDNPVLYRENRPYSIENLIYSLSSLSKLHYEDYDPKLSIFDSTFVPQKRTVGNKPYEEIIRNTQRLF
ncbi:MAG: sulfatase-like hydrolase/transferase [Dysgonamonadaceae bacterium]|jgi:heptose-I-phosphate ethanolaminephosphotransferase|nr:sulfatase-like hydrolase/transferase [Dysgonamonadaceae bacterium]